MARPNTFDPHGRGSFVYFTVWNDAGNLRKALTEDLSEWITSGFVSPHKATRWQAACRRLSQLARTSRPELVDQLYADAALILGAPDDAALVRVSEIS